MHNHGGGGYLQPKKVAGTCFFSNNISSKNMGKRLFLKIYITEWGTYYLQIIMYQRVIDLF